MLDPDEFRRYEEWRAERIEAADDLSVEKFNAEQAHKHSVWNQGFIAGSSGMPRDSNPYPSPTEPKKETPLI